MQGPAPEEVEWPETYEVEIYKIQHKTDEKLERYVGCTTRFKKRRILHKSACNNPNDNGHNTPVYKYIRDHGGWDSWEMTLLAVEFVENKEEQDNLEHQFINLMGATLNKAKPGAWQRAGGEKEYNRQSTRDYNSRLGLNGNPQDCPCGGTYTKNNETQHKRSPQHTRYEEAIQNSTEYVAPTKGMECPCGGRFIKRKEKRHKKCLRHQRYEASLQINS